MHLHCIFWQGKFKELCKEKCIQYNGILQPYILLIPAFISSFFSVKKVNTFAVDNDTTSQNAKMSFVYLDFHLSML